MVGVINRAFRIAFARALRKKGSASRELAFSNAAYTLSGYLALAFAALTSLGMITFYWLARDGNAPSDDELNSIALVSGLIFVVISTALRKRYGRHMYEMQDALKPETTEDRRFWLYFRVVCALSMPVILLFALMVWPPN